MPKSNPNLTSIFTDVANAIREKKSESGSIYPVDFADEISTIVTANLPTLEPPDLYDGTLSSPFHINTKTQNGVFIDEVDYRIGEKSYRDSFHVNSNPNEQGIIPWIYGITPLEGGTFTVFAKGKGENFNDSPEVSKSITIPSATESPAYCSVAGLGNEDPTSQVYTYDPNFPRSFQEVQDIYGNTFIKIPTIYRKILNVTDGQITSFAISTSALDSDYKPYPCFIDRTNNNAILPYILIGKWCMSSTTTANSINGTPSDIYLNDARVLAKARGTGYQLFDWQMWELFRNLGLVISHYMKISPYYDYSRLMSVLGIMQIENQTYVDGVLEGSTNDPNQYYCAYDPNDYYSEKYSVPSEAMILSHNYIKLSYKSPSSGSGSISKVGYDPNNPFFNQANEQNGNSDYTYYCSSSALGTDRSSSIATVLSGYQSGWYACKHDVGREYNYKYYARLCYRPILNATGYVE